MKINLLVLSCMLLSFSAFSMPCGKVPIYCIYAKNVYNPKAEKINYYLDEKALGCVPTSFSLGKAAPLCQRESINEQFYFNQCAAKDHMHVVGIAYYKGGDPVNPFNEADKRLYGTSYHVVSIFSAARKEDVGAVNLFGNLKSYSCDVITH